MADDGTVLHSPKRLMDARGLRPRKRFGQNFLVDPRFAQRVADALPEGAFALEIGAGTGSLTAALSARTRMTIALEIDRDLVALLRERFEGSPNVDVHEGDALEFDVRGALGSQRPPRAVCGNLPYYITTPLVEHILACADVWETAVLMVQREYARRLTARPGTAEYASLTVFVSYYCTVEKLFDVGSAGFYPAPAVASSVVRLTPRTDRGAGVRDEALLLKTIRAAFAQRRKTLANCLTSARPAGLGGRVEVEAAIRAAGLDPSIRGERLSLEAFVRLADALSENRISLL